MVGHTDGCSGDGDRLVREGDVAIDLERCLHKYECDNAQISVMSKVESI